MKYEANKRMFTASIIERSRTIKSNNQEMVIIAESKGDMARTIKKRFGEFLARGSSISWNEGTKYEVNVNREASYYDENMKTIETHLVTRIGQIGNMKVIEHSPKMELNPFYKGDDVECQFCYKMVKKVYHDHLAHSSKSKIDVCSKCRKILKTARKFQSSKC